jgi:hypothetical protein
MDDNGGLNETYHKKTLIAGDEVRSDVSENDYSDLKYIVDQALGGKEVDLGEIQKLLNQAGLFL